MMDDLIFALTLVSALGCGLTAGWFFAFSNHIMRALGRIPDAQGITAMQEINIVVINPLAMTVLFGPALTCIALAVLSVVDWDEPEVFYHLAGGALYVVGTVLVTMAFNVPRNDALAAADPASATGQTSGGASSQSGPSGTTFVPSPRSRPRFLLPLALVSSCVGESFRSIGLRSPTRSVHLPCTTPAPVVPSPPEQPAAAADDYRVWVPHQAHRAGRSRR